MKIKNLLGLGFCGAAVTYLAEFIFHFVPWQTAQTLLSNQSFLILISQERLALGYVFLLIGAPLYFLGYLGLFLWLSEIKKEKISPLFLVAAYGMLILGIIWMSGRPVVSLSLQQEVSLPLFNDLQALTIFGLRALLFSTSLYLVWATRKTALWPMMIFANPFFIWAIVFVGFFIIPSVFWPLVVVAFNAAHVVFFATMIKLHKKYE
jgi:hypothetical protein